MLRGRRADPGAGWGEVLRLAEAHFLLPALWSSGVAAGRWTALPDEVVTTVDRRFPPGAAPPTLLLQQAHGANLRRNADLLDQADTVTTTLSQHGIPAVPLKGLHTLEGGWWPDPGARVLRDLDILVPPSDGPAAADCLRTLGYRPTGDRDPLADHELPALHWPGRAGSVELHVLPLVSRLPVLDPVLLLRRGRMTTTEAVLHTIAHAQLQDDGHLLGRLPLRALHEITTVCGTPLGREIDWTAVRCGFRRVRAEAALDGFLAMAARWFGADVPSPRRPRRAAVHVALTTTLSSHRGAARTYETVSFQRRQLSHARLAVLRPEARSVWSARAQHVAAGAARWAAASGQARGRST